METGEPWWPGLLVAVVSSLILLLFLVNHLPPLQKWLLPVLTRIAPPNNLTTTGPAVQQLHPRSSRPSRPSSLPCLPEEDKLVYYYPSTTSSSVVAVAAAAAAQAAQAAAMPPHHSFYPPPEEDDEEEEDCATPQQQQVPYPPQQRGRVHHKLNLVSLHR